MTLQEAMKTNCFFRRPNWGMKRICWYKQNSGPFRHLVQCDYFTIEDGGFHFSTSIDLYAEDLLSEDYEIVGF